MHRHTNVPCRSTTTVLVLPAAVTFLAAAAAGAAEPEEEVEEERYEDEEEEEEEFSFPPLERLTVAVVAEARLLLLLPAVREPAPAAAQAPGAPRPPARWATGSYSSGGWLLATKALNHCMNSRLSWYLARMSLGTSTCCEMGHG